MSIDRYFFRTVCRTLKDLQSSKRLTVATLGYPDLLVTETMFKNQGIDTNKLEVRKKFADTSMHKKLRAKLEADGTEHLYTAESFFDYFNMNIDVFDVYSHLGIERILDLNESLPFAYVDKYDLILDVGTLEHCFNVGQAFKNIMQMTKLNGSIFMAGPASKINHGFWNFNPTAYTDIFHQNGWVIKDLIGVKGTTRDIGELVEHNLDYFIPDPENRKMYPNKPEEVIIMCIAKKVKQQEFQYPLQMKYAGDREDKTLYKELQNMYSNTKKTTVLDGEKTLDYSS